jgi:seryl-tRNA synthetase
MNALPIRSGASLRTFDQLDSGIRGWALKQGCEEWRFPVLISAETLCRAEYLEAFPHLVMASAVAAEPAAPFADANVRLAGWFLSPAVCYHAYAALAGAKVERGHLITARGSCFRHEDAAALAPGRRQIEFEMRELILVGAPDWIEERLATLRSGVEALAAECGFDGAAWQPASDPFFLPRAVGKAHMQRLLGTKIELCLPDGLAIASINRHGPFFGERFDIRTVEDTSAHSACVAFGLDRWAAHQTKAL